MEDIKIIGVDKEKTRRLQGELYVVYFVLSDTPPPEWVLKFMDNWHHSMSYLRKRWACMAGKYLIITGKRDEIEKDHFPQLKRLVKKTNAEYRESRATKRETEERQRKEAEEERRRIEQVLDNLSFDE